MEPVADFLAVLVVALAAEVRAAPCRHRSPFRYPCFCSRAASEFHPDAARRVHPEDGEAV
jgi:hypothetical protein